MVLLFLCAWKLLTRSSVCGLCSGGDRFEYSVKCWDRSCLIFGQDRFLSQVIPLAAVSRRSRVVTKSTYLLCHVCPSARIGAAATGGTCVKFDTLDFGGIC